MSRASSSLQLPSSGINRVSGTQRNSPQQLAGLLIQRDANGTAKARRKVYANKEFLIGRDRSKCQYVIGDATISKKHVRIYSVVYDNDSSEYQVDILVYAEDLSRNGTYWNGSLIGKDNGGFLLSHDDKLKLAPDVFLEFQAYPQPSSVEHFDEVQEVEMAKFRQSFVLTDRLLGAGAFGKVFMAVEQSARRQLACKVVDLRKLRPSIPIGQIEFPAAAEDVDSRVQKRKVKDWAEKQKRGNKLENKLRLYSREFEILSSISHPNIIGLEKVFVTDNNVYMFQDLVTGGDLFSYIESKNGMLLEVEAAVVTRQILIALEFLHERNIVHRDLKPDNILMTSSSAGCRIVLTDFGAARRLEHSLHRLTSLAGTEEYTAPEVRYNKSSGSKKSQLGYTKSVDLWSLGCVAVVMLTGGGAFVDPSTGIYSENLANACDLAFLRNSSAWEYVRDRPKSFVESLLVLEENNRMTATQALQHEWFANDAHKTNFEDLYRRTIRHWRCRAFRRDVLEFRDAAMVQHIVLSRSPGFSPSGRVRGDDAVEAHCKPVPKKVYSTLYPRKKSGSPMASEEVRQAIRGWLANSNNQDIFEEQDDDDEDESHAQHSKRHNLLRSNQSHPKLLASRSQRSGSAPPQQTNSPYFQSQRRSNVGKTREALPQEQILRLPATHNSASAPSEHASESVLRSTVRGHDKRPTIPASIFVKDFAESSAHENIHVSTPELQVKLFAIPRSVQSVSPHNGQASVAEENLALDLSTPIRTKGLKRWNSSPLSDASSSRSSSKRHRGSIFDIAEEEDIEPLSSHHRDVKYFKKVRFPHNMDVASGDNEEDAEEDEITLPHHPVSLKDRGTSSAEGHLYLPR